MDRWTKPLIESTTKRVINFAVSMHNHHLGKLEVQIDFNLLNSSFLGKMQKCEKQKKIPKILAAKLSIAQNSAWPWGHLKEEI